MSDKNSYIINRMGQIRGGIQRYSKFKLFDKDGKNIKLFIDKSITEIERFIEKRADKDEKRVWQKVWKKLKSAG